MCVCVWWWWTVLHTQSRSHVHNIDTESLMRAIVNWTTGEDNSTKSGTQPAILSEHLCSYVKLHAVKLEFNTIYWFLIRLPSPSFVYAFLTLISIWLYDSIMHYMLVQRYITVFIFYLQFQTSTCWVVTLFNAERSVNIDSYLCTFEHLNVWTWIKIIKMQHNRWIWYDELIFKYETVCCFFFSVDAFINYRNWHAYNWYVCSTSDMKCVIFLWFALCQPIALYFQHISFSMNHSSWNEQPIHVIDQAPPLFLQTRFSCIHLLLVSFFFWLLVSTPYLFYW